MALIYTVLYLFTKMMICFYDAMPVGPPTTLLVNRKKSTLFLNQSILYSHLIPFQHWLQLRSSLFLNFHCAYHLYFLLQFDMDVLNLKCKIFWDCIKCLTFVLICSTHTIRLMFRLRHIKK